MVFNSRRDFVKRFGAAALTAGTLGAGSSAEAPQGQTPPALPEPPKSAFPGLNRRTLGWLNFLWEKATTDDDWTSAGVPHQWWDRYTAPVVLSYGRFDLAYSTYALLLMADQTPAWREVYTRIADRLASRYPTYWGAIDWLTQIGDDPKRANYPPRVMNQIPERLRGNYNRIGWTGNGIEPWGLQPDPIGADGNLFFRGWFTLMLSIYKYVSGDDKWAKPFKVTGYRDEEFEWDHHRIAERLEQQYRAHPEGPHCENTKIWYFCNSAAGLGLHLYDKVYAKQTHLAVQNFLEYARKNYMGVSSDGTLEWITSYYDPIVNYKANAGAAGGLSTAFLVLPQNRELAAMIYDAAANAAGWRNARGPVAASSAGLLMARELGDRAVVERLSEAAEREYEPRFFGKQDEKFGWWFKLNEGYPRGQQSATMMVSEVGSEGDWLRAFETPHRNKFQAPTVEGIDFPSLGVYQAWNDAATGTLNVGTYPATPDKRGTATSFRVTNLPNAKDVVVRADGQPYTRFEVVGPGTIRIDTSIETRRYQIVTGYRGVARAGHNQGDNQDNVRRDQTEARSATASAAVACTAERPATNELIADAGLTCPCCRA